MISELGPRRIPFVIVNDASAAAWNITVYSLFCIAVDGLETQLTVTLVTFFEPTLYRMFLGLDPHAVKKPDTFSVIVLPDTVRYVSTAVLTSVFSVSYAVLSVCNVFRREVMFVDAVVIICVLF